MTGTLAKTALGGDDGHVPIRIYWYTPIPPMQRGRDWLSRNLGSASISIRVQPTGYKLILVPFYNGDFEARNHYDIRACGEDLQGFIESIPDDLYHVFVFSLEPIQETLIYPGDLFTPKSAHTILLMKPTIAARDYVEDVLQFGWLEVPFAQPRSVSSLARRLNKTIQLDLSRESSRRDRIAIAANIVVGLRTPIVLHELFGMQKPATIMRASQILEHYVEPAP